MMLRSFVRVTGGFLPVAQGFPAAAQRAWNHSASASQSSSNDDGQGYEAKLVVFGGRGFVGSAICQEAVKCGLQVISISPSGTPPLEKSTWAQQVTWARGSAQEPATYQHHLQGALAAISCVGAFGSQQHMLQVNGESNKAAIQAAAAAGVPRFVYISAHIPNMPMADQLVRGYIDGKKAAEEALFAAYPKAGIALRPSFIYGNRHVTNSISIPLQLVGGPWKALLSHVPQAQAAASLPFVGALFTPPVSVEAVAKTAVQAATDATAAGGVIDVWDIAKQDE